MLEVNVIYIYKEIKYHHLSILIKENLLAIKERKYTSMFWPSRVFGFSGLNGNPYNLLWFSFAVIFTHMG